MHSIIISCMHDGLQSSRYGVSCNKAFFPRWMLQHCSTSSKLQEEGQAACSTRKQMIDSDHWHEYNFTQSLSLILMLPASH